MYIRSKKKKNLTHFYTVQDINLYICRRFPKSHLKKIDYNFFISMLSTFEFEFMSTFDEPTDTSSSSVSSLPFKLEYPSNSLLWFSLNL